jgi:hypothetical protein
MEAGVVGGQKAWKVWWDGGGAACFLDFPARLKAQSGKVPLKSRDDINGNNDQPTVGI